MIQINIIKSNTFSLHTVPYFVFIDVKNYGGITRKEYNLIKRLVNNKELAKLNINNDDPMIQYICELIIKYRKVIIKE
jgi:hypothetical protein